MPEPRVTRLRYRSLAGDVYDAEARNPIIGRCGPVVAIFPGEAQRYEMAAIPYVGADNGARGVCFSTEDSHGQKS